MANKSEIIRLALEGLPPREIAARTGATSTYCSTVLSHARATGTEIRRFGSGRRAKPNGRAKRALVIAADLARDLEPFADRRGVSVQEIVRRLVTAVVEDGIVDAILDDGEQAT